MLLEAVAYIHEIGLIHTDLKPENILLEHDRVERISMSPAGRYQEQSGHKDGR